MGAGSVGRLRAFFRREAPGFGLWGWDVWWSRGPVPEGGWYGKGQGGGFLSSERPGAELKAEREGVERGKDGSLTPLEKE